MNFVLIIIIKKYVIIEKVMLNIIIKILESVNVLIKGIEWVSIYDGINVMINVVVVMRIGLRSGFNKWVFFLYKMKRKSIIVMVLFIMCEIVKFNKVVFMKR